MESRKVLCIGGAGYIGSRLVPALLERGYDVQVEDLFWFGDHLPDVRKFKRDAAKLTEQDLKDFHTVIWLAGLSNDPMAEFSPARNFVENAATPAYIAYIAKRAGVRRFIHGGSCSVYGYAAEFEHDETSPPNTNFPYGISKLQAETGCAQLIDENFSVIMLRKGTVSGYSPRMRFDLLANTMFKDALVHRKITVSNPTIWRPLLCIEDAVNAYIHSIEADDNISGVFNIITENVTILDVAMRIKYALSAKSLTNVAVNIKHGQDKRNYRVSADKATRILGYLPTASVETIIGDLWLYRDQFGDYTNPSYYNLQTFKAL